MGFRCSKCGGEFDDDRRATGFAQCRDCRAAYVSAWRAAHPGRNAELCRQRAQRDPERVKREQAEYRNQPANVEKARQRSADWYRANKERALAWQRENRERLHESHRLASRISSAKLRVRQSISNFFRAEIRAFYANCPLGMEVDHIEPLNGGDDFCGLHVPWNLQYLSPQMNWRKRNQVV